MAQEYLSGETCINGKQGKLPAIYSKENFTEGITIFDYGCGKTTDLVEQKMNDAHINWVGYDLNWHPDTLDTLHNGVEVAVCSNVLNVIKEDEIIKDIIKDCVENSDQSIFSIYPGNGSGIGKPTQNNKSWQRNAPRQFYIDLITSLGYYIQKTNGNLIYVKGEN